jgi:hypothetical protein
MTEWECPAGCGEPHWAHQLYSCAEDDDDALPCPPAPEPRDCCGRFADATTDEERVCSNDACTAWWCLCGTFTGISAGPVFCGCEYDRGEVPTTRDDAAAIADDDLA